MIRPTAFALLTVLGLSFFGTQEARSETEVDLALVLAVDVSRSMDPDEQDLQRHGFMEAFRSPLVHAAIRAGALGRITVAYVEWSGETDQRVVVPWTLIEDPEDALAFAERLGRAPMGRASRTSISGVIDFGVKLIDASGTQPIRRVIDISGDGPNSSGRMVTLARDEAVAKGITINGLPIMLKRPTGFGDMEHLDRYYRDCVIGGPGAFIVPVRERHQFAEAIEAKIVREIAGLASEPLIRRIQFESPMDCSARQNSNRRGFGP
jgi:Protein of unknown function (DUF1194)